MLAGIVYGSTPVFCVPICCWLVVVPCWCFPLNYEISMCLSPAAPPTPPSFTFAFGPPTISAASLSGESRDDVCVVVGWSYMIVLSALLSSTFDISTFVSSMYLYGGWGFVITILLGVQVLLLKFVLVFCCCWSSWCCCCLTKERNEYWKTLHTTISEGAPSHSRCPHQLLEKRALFRQRAFRTCSFTFCILLTSLGLLSSVSIRHFCSLTFD